MGKEHKKHNAEHKKHMKFLCFLCFRLVLFVFLPRNVCTHFRPAFDENPNFLAFQMFDASAIFLITCRLNDTQIYGTYQRFHALHLCMRSRGCLCDACGCACSCAREEDSNHRRRNHRPSVATRGRVSGSTRKLSEKRLANLIRMIRKMQSSSICSLHRRISRGRVEYAFDFYILKPIDLSKGNHKMLYEPPNRGGKTISAFNRGVGGNDPGAVTDASLLANSFLMPQGYSISFSGWDLSAGTSTANFNTTITLPIARNSDGSSITGPSYEYIVNAGDFI